MMRHHHGNHPWAQPGDEPDRVFILRFSDRDAREQVFLGPDAEQRAHAAYRLYAPAWSVYLLATVSAADIGPEPMVATPPDPPFPVGAGNNAKRIGWEAYFQTKARDASPFPPARRDLLAGYVEGWDAAAEWDLLHGDGTAPPLGFFK